MTKNFFINEIKDERIKVVKKKSHQFIILHFIVEKKKGFFWDKLYMESFAILPDPIKEMKVISLQDFEMISYEQKLPDKTTIIVDFFDLDIANLIYVVYSNYTLRLELYQNSSQYAETINEWSKMLDAKINDISETEIEITD